MSQTLIPTKFLTENSTQKLHTISEMNHNLTTYSNSRLNKILHNFVSAAKSNIILETGKPIPLYDLQHIFIKFNQTVNHVSKSKFRSDIKQMNIQFNFTIKVNTAEKIQINFLCRSNEHTNLIGAILHAINTFTKLFPYDYNGLVINLAMDSNKRDVIKNSKNSTNILNFNQMTQQSVAFNASGVTNRFDQTIVLTKTEDMIKLLFHELVHYVGLDHELLSIEFPSKWDTDKTTFNISEAYAEFLSIVLNSMFNAVYLGCVGKDKSNNTIDLIFRQIYAYEIEYSKLLSASILKYYGYTSKTYTDFFQSKSKQNHSPIQTWEYVFLRTIMMLSPKSILTNDLRLDSESASEIELILTETQSFIDLLKPYMESKLLLSNVAYACVELNYDLV